MGKGFKHGGSGGTNPLNFFVKTYPAETELKADKPKENTIGVITTTTMTSWGFYATEPTVPEVGMVWFFVKTESVVEFNALKKNAIQVYPFSAKQYVDSKWVEVAAMSYINGAWVEWDTRNFVFKSGSGFNDTVYKKLATNSSLTSSNYTVLNYSVSSGNTTLDLNSYANGNDYCPVAFDIDLSKFNTMYIDAAVSKSNGSDSAFAVNVVSEGTSNLGSNPIGTQLNPSKDGVRQTFNYNVKSITTTKRVCISTWNGRKTKIYNIWFE